MCSIISIVCVQMYHEQNIQKMGNCWKKIPCTYALTVQEGLNDNEYLHRKKIIRCIINKILPEDRQFYKILWRFYSNKPPKTTAQALIKSSPYHVLLVLRQLADDDKSNFFEVPIQAVENFFIGFAGACPSPYGERTYLKTLNPDEEMKVNLIYAKSKVASSKLRTISKIRNVCCASYW